MGLNHLFCFVTFFPKKEKGLYMFTINDFFPLFFIYYYFILKIILSRSTHYRLDSLGFESW